MGNIIEDKTMVSESSHICLKQISGSVSSRSDNWKPPPCGKKKVDFSLLCG